MERVVIVGGGQAAAQAAMSLRQEGYAGEVVILTGEPHFPYQRPPLSKQFLAGEQEVERIYLRPAAFYADNHIEVLTQHRVASVNLESRSVSVAGNTSFDFSHLIFATGSRVRQLSGFPGSELEHIAYLRTLEDAENLKAQMHSKEHQQLVVIGGGYIGLEVAAVATQAGMSVTVVELMPRLLSRVATPHLSEFYTTLHQTHGVTLKTGVKITRITGDKHTTSMVHLDNEEQIPADIIVAGIGIVPNSELAQEAGLACANGIAVDTHCRTAHPNVFAIGDCTNHPNPYAGKNIRLESVPNAIEQARVAAANIAGKVKVYDAEPWFWSDQYDVKLQMAGFTEGADQRIPRGEMTSGAGIMFYLQQGTVTGIEAINSVRDFLNCRKLVASRVRPDPAQLADPDVPLKTLLATV